MHTVITLYGFSPLAAMLTSLQQIPQATSPLTSRVIPGASSPGPLDIYTQDPLSYVQATSPQPAGFGGLTLNRVSTWVKVFRINPEFRILRLTFQRKSASKCWIREITIASLIRFQIILTQFNI